MRNLSALAAALLASTALAVSSAQNPPAAPAAPAKEAPQETGKAPAKPETQRGAPASKGAKPNVAGFVGDPYPLDTCPVAGEKLGADAVTVVLKDQKDPLQEGRQIRFCCKECVAKFEAKPAEYIAKIDAEIIRLNAASYPLSRCLVMENETLEGDAKTIVYGNRCYKACCKKCVGSFQRNPGKFVAAYESAVIAQQAENYPLDTCVVSGEKIGEKHVEFVVGSKLVRACCDDCAKKVLTNPAPYLAKITAASNGDAATKK
jgi:YHS domain-containing protein